MINQNNKLEGRVATILNARELVINIGSEGGVELDMVFAVLSETPTIVKDPETDAELDRIDREKVRVVVIEVRSKIAVCRTFRVKRVPGGPLSMSGLMGINNLIAPPQEIPETLRLADAAVLPPLPEEESYVKVKDRVVQVPKE